MSDAHPLSEPTFLDFGMPYANEIFIIAGSPRSSGAIRVSRANRATH
jgi:hypothetical protein